MDFNLFPDDERCYRTISFRDNETNEQYSNLMESKLAKGQSVEQIADALEESPERIRELMEKRIV